MKFTSQLFFIFMAMSFLLPVMGKGNDALAEFRVLGAKLEFGGKTGTGIAPIDKGDHVETIRVISGQKLTLGTNASHAETGNGEKLYHFWSGTGIAMTPKSSDFRTLEISAPYVDSLRRFKVYWWTGVNSGDTSEKWYVIEVVPLGYDLADGGDEWHDLSTQKVVSDDYLDVTHRVVNEGTRSSGQFSIRYFLSEDAVIEPETDRQVGFRSEQSLSANSSRNISSSIHLSTSIAPGYYFLGWSLVGAEENRDETDLHDNTKGVSVGVIQILPIGSGTLDVKLDHFAIDDNNASSSSGDDDGQVDAGETIELDIFLRNEGSSVANNVTLDISSVSPWVTVIRSSQIYASGIYPGGAPKGEEFVFSVNPDCPGGEVLSFRGVISTSEGRVYENFEIPVVSGVSDVPSPDFGGFYGLSATEINEEAGGNNDGLVDAGEYIRIQPTLFNSGDVDATNVRVRFTSNDPRVEEIQDAEVFWASIPVGSHSQNGQDFEIKVSASASASDSVPFTLLITTDQGEFQRNSSFLVTQAAAANPTLEILDPLPGSTVNAGETTMIRWNSSEVSSDVNLELYRFGEFIRTIANTPNTGSYSWNVPNDIASSGYQIRISQTDGAVSDITNGSFLLDTGIFLSPTGISIGGSGAQLNRRGQVSANGAWRAESTVPWIVITSDPSGYGNGEIIFDVLANPGSNSRSGEIRVGGEAISIGQGGKIPPLPQQRIEVPGESPVHSISAMTSLENPIFKQDFGGLIFDSSENENVIGVVRKLSLRSGGRFSATVFVNNRTFRLKGIFDESSGTFSKIILINRGGSYNVAFQMARDSGGSPAVLGSVYGEGISGEMRLEFLRYGIPVDNIRTPAGKFTFLMPASEREVNEPWADGYGVMTLSRWGGIRMSGRTGDNTRFSGSAYLNANAGFSTYFPIYSKKNRGFLSGQTTFRDFAEISDFDGNWTWKKPASPADKFHPEGFQVQQQVVGSIFTPTAKNIRVVQGLPGGGEFLRTQISGGGYDFGILGNEDLICEYSSSNRVRFLSETDRLELTINQKSGLIGGWYQDRLIGVKVKLRGAVLQKQALGSGVFQGATRSGLFTITGVTVNPNSNF